MFGKCIAFVTVVIYGSENMLFEKVRRMKCFRFIRVMEQKLETFLFVL